MHAQMAPVSEPTLAFTMEARMDRESATIALLLPYSTIAPVAHRFSSRDDLGDEKAGQADAVRAAVGQVEMTVQAEVAAVELPIEQVLALQPGDVVPLGASAAEGVTLYAGGVPVHRAAPGRSGSRRAVQITERIGEVR
jgi:flagellar motor switch protein FliM